MLEQVLADPPSVHLGDPPGGVWSTEESCYRFLAEHCPPGTRTLETGLGVSTVLFAAWRAEHTCFVFSKVEVEKCEAYLDGHGIPRDNVEFIAGPSDALLPQRMLHVMDLFMIDGGHAFPIPVIDWYFGARWLRKGGVLVVDDLQLPAVSDGLIDFLDRDPRWMGVARTGKWAAYRRETEGILRENWEKQPFLFERRGWVGRVRRPLGRLKRAVLGRK